MTELLIFCLFGASLFLVHIGAVVVWKIKTKSKKSVWELIGKF